MNIFGKSDLERNSDAKNLKTCVENFSKLIFNAKKLITYGDINNLYCDAFEEYLKSKKRFSHTNDILKKIQKKIARYDKELILGLTYKKYCSCYKYDQEKKNKDAAICDDEVINEYNKMLSVLGNKLKFIIDNNKTNETSKSSPNDNKFKLAIIEYCTEAKEKLEKLELKGVYYTLSRIFNETWEKIKNIKPNKKEDKPTLSKINSVFKDINKKLKSFDDQVISNSTYKKYIECFNYKLDNSLYNNFNEFTQLLSLMTDISSTKLKKYLKGENNDSSQYGEFIKALNDLKKEILKKIRTSDNLKEINERLKNFFETEIGANYFSGLTCLENHFYDSRFCASRYSFNFLNSQLSKEFSEALLELGNFLTDETRKRVKEIEKEAENKLDNRNYKILSKNLNLDELACYFEKSKGYSRIMAFSVIKTIIFEFENDKFEINGGKSFGDYWEGFNGAKVMPKLKNVIIQGGKLSSIGTEIFRGVDTLKRVEFKDVMIDDAILRNLRNLLGISSSVVITIDGIDINDVIKSEQSANDLLSSTLKSGSGFMKCKSPFSLSNFEKSLKDVLGAGADAILALNKFSGKLIFYFDKNFKIAKNAFEFKLGNKKVGFFNLNAICFSGNGKLTAIEKHMENDMPMNLKSIQFDHVDTKQLNLKKIKELLPVPEIYIGSSEIDTLIKSEKDKIKQILSNNIEISQFTKKAFNKFLDTKFKDMNKEFVNEVYSKIKSLTFKIKKIQIPKEQVIDRSLFASVNNIRFEGKLVGIDKKVSEGMGLKSLKEVYFDDIDDGLSWDKILSIFPGGKYTVNVGPDKELKKRQEELKKALNIQLSNISELNNKITTLSATYADIFNEVCNGIQELTLSVKFFEINNENDKLEIINLFQNLKTINFKVMNSVNFGNASDIGIGEEIQVNFDFSNYVSKLMIPYYKIKKVLPNCTVDSRGISEIIKEKEAKFKEEIEKDIEIQKFSRMYFVNTFIPNHFDNEEIYKKIFADIETLTFKIGEIGIANEQVIDHKLFRNLKNINFKGKLVEISRYANKKMGLESLEKVTFYDYDSEHVKLEDIKNLFKGCKITINSKDIKALIKEQKEKEEKEKEEQQQQQQEEGQQQETN